MVVGRKKSGNTRVEEPSGCKGELHLCPFCAPRESVTAQLCRFAVTDLRTVATLQVYPRIVAQALSLVSQRSSPRSQ